jgi:DNA topoisomerase-1
LKWKSLRHNGVAFPPPFDHRGLTLKIKNESFALNAEQEEMLMAWAKKKDTPYVQDPDFQRNFLGDLKQTLPERFAGIALSDLDWAELYAIADREKTANLSDEEKKRRSAERKAERESLKARYGIAHIDDIETEVGAYLVEPPGILMGRGKHPLRGKWKGRVQPEDVTLNLDEDAPVPPAPEGHTWGKIVHDHDSMWIATWYDKLSDKRKYVWLADSSHLRQERDKEKYVKATKLESSVERVRREIAKRMDYTDAAARSALDKQRKELHDSLKQTEAQLLQATQAGNRDGRKKLEDRLAALQSKLRGLDKSAETVRAEEMKTRQLASVCYLIDRMAMRVGDEKEEDEADTVGASTLRVEHIQLGRDRIEFNFLGKDSIEWHKSMPLDHDGTILAHNMQDFMREKQPGDQIFDKIDSTHVNRFLSSIVPGLSAKVFRTYHATHAVRAFLINRTDLTPMAPLYEKEYVAKLANLEAATVCNHKRTPAKNWQENLAKREVEIQALRAQQPDLNKLEAQAKARELALQKLSAARPDPQKLAAQLAAREAMLKKLLAAQANSPKLEEQIKARQAEVDKLTATYAEFESKARELLNKTQAALVALESRPQPRAKKALAQHMQRLTEKRKAVAEVKKENDAKLKNLNARVAKARKSLERASQAQRAQTKSLKRRVVEAQKAFKRARQAVETEPRRHIERIAQAEQALERARQAPQVAQQNYKERIEKASLQLDLAKRTLDYNLGTSLKNYIDPRVYKSWGDYIGYDWKRLYTTALQRKFAWVEQERGKWNAEAKRAEEKPGSSG